MNLLGNFGLFLDTKYGEWMAKSWRKSFYESTLPGFVTNDLMDYGDLMNDTNLVAPKRTKKFPNYHISNCGVVYLPFCPNCFVETISSYSVLSQYYTISFVKRNELKEHFLWKGTQLIKRGTMQKYFGKKLRQEDEYCVLTRNKLTQSSALSGCTSVTTEEVLQIYDSIVKPEKVRMIKLTALRKFHPSYKRSSLKSSCAKVGLEIGGYVGFEGHQYWKKRITNQTMEVQDGN
jgi:hypothetical protein